MEGGPGRCRDPPPAGCRSSPPGAIRRPHPPGLPGVPKLRANAPAVVSPPTTLGEEPGVGALAGGSARPDPAGVPSRTTTGANTTAPSLIGRAPSPKTPD